MDIKKHLNDARGIIDYILYYIIYKSTINYYNFKILNHGGQVKMIHQFRTTVIALNGYTYII